MGQRGPQPTPTAVLAARGSWRAKANENAGEPKPPTGEPERPDGLSEPEQAAWEAVCKVLAEMGVLTRADGSALERYVRHLVRWRTCEAFIAQHGISHPLKADPSEPPTSYIERLPRPGDTAETGPTGEYVVGYVEYIQVRESHRLHKALKDAEDRFGLSPAARTRIRSEAPAAGGGEGDPLGDLAHKFGLN